MEGGVPLFQQKQRQFSYKQQGQKTLLAKIILSILHLSLNLLHNTRL
jgi:hypothetical protein